MLPCIFPENACVFAEDNESFIENIFVYARELGNSSILLYSTVGTVISMTIYNSTGVYVTKKLTSLARSVCDVSRTLIIWIVGVILTASIGQ
jgi:presenilin-like A22 family membrane protease